MLLLGVLKSVADVPRLYSSLQMQWNTWKKKHLTNCFSMQQTDFLPMPPSKILYINLHVSKIV